MGWDEFADDGDSIVAFCDMASGEDYQAANARWRLPVSFSFLAVPRLLS